MTDPSLYRAMLSMTCEIHEALKNDDAEEVLSLSEKRKSVFINIKKGNIQINEETRPLIEKIMTMEKRIRELAEKKTSMLKESFLQLSYQKNIARAYGNQLHPNL